MGFVLSTILNGDAIGTKVCGHYREGGHSSEVATVHRMGTGLTPCNFVLVMSGWFISLTKHNFNIVDDHYIKPNTIHLI